MVALSGGMGVFCKTDYLLFLQLLKTANRLLLMRDPPGVFQLPSVRILVLDYLGHSSYGSSLYLPERKCIWGEKKKTSSPEMLHSEFSLHAGKALAVSQLPTMPCVVL